MKNRSSFILTIYTALFYLYIFAPIILIFLFAWNSKEGYSFPLGDFTWRWFGEFLQDEIALRSIRNSVIIAVISATLSTFLGTFLTLGVLKGIRKKRIMFLSVLMLPVLMPSLTIGISALVFFRTINLPLGIPLVIIAHVSISMSYVFLILMGRIEDLSDSIQEASVDLGASWARSIIDIVLPVILPAVIAGWLFSFMISWNEFIITYFLIGNDITLPIYIFSQMRFGISPTVNVIAVLITGFTLLLLGLLFGTRRVFRKMKMQ